MPTLAGHRQDKAVAEKQYGVPANVGTEFSVKFSCRRRESPASTPSRSPTPDPWSFACNRPGDQRHRSARRHRRYHICQFINQIEHERGLGPDNEMKKQVLSTIKHKLSGKTISVVMSSSDQSQGLAGHAREAERPMNAAPEFEPAAGDTVLAARNIVKTYGGTHALKGVNFDIHRGKVTTLFGENGAGKSTLMKILSGVTTPTSGSIELDGKSVTFSSSSDARDRGISIIHQELSLAPNLSVRDNIFMGREIPGATGVDFAEEARQTRQLMADLDEDIDPRRWCRTCPGATTIVEIARASVDPS